MTQQFPRTIIIFFAILILASFLRLRDLAHNPMGFYADEASIGYNAYTILTSGVDEHGNPWPLFFRAFGEYKNAFAIYPVVPFMALFGPREIAVRMTHALWGVLDVILIYFLGKELWNRKAGLLTSFLLAVTPWHIHISRFMIESHNMFLFFIIAGTLFFLRTLKTKKLLDSLLTAISFGLSFYTYFATRIFTPLYLLGLAFFFRRPMRELYQKKYRVVLVATALFLTIILPFIFHMLWGGGLERFGQVAETEKNTLAVLEKKSKLYINHLELPFVFVYGDSGYPGQQIQRHSIPGIGLLYKWQLPFFVVGFLAIVLKKTNRGLVLPILLLQLLLYPLGSVASSAATPYATRSIVGVIPYTLLTAYGLYSVFRFSQKVVYPSYSGLQLKEAAKLIRGIYTQTNRSFLSIGSVQANLVLGIVIISGFYLTRFLYLSEAYKNYASAFQYGAKEVVDYFMSQDDRYRIMILHSGLDGQQAYINFFSLGRCRHCFAADPEPKNTSELKLLSVSPEGFKDFTHDYEGEKIKTVFYPDGSEAFFIFEAYSRSKTPSL